MANFRVKNGKKLNPRFKLKEKSNDSNKKMKRIRKKGFNRLAEGKKINYL